MSSRTVTSARGELVDFDLMRIKQQIATSPQTIAPRESFIDKKMKRRLKNTQPLPDQNTSEEK